MIGESIEAVNAGIGPVPEEFKPIVGIELAEQKDAYLPIHNNAHEVIIAALESNFGEEV